MLVMYGCACTYIDVAIYINSFLFMVLIVCEHPDALTTALCS